MTGILRGALGMAVALAAACGGPAPVEQRLDEPAQPIAWTDTLTSLAAAAGARQRYTVQCSPDGAPGAAWGHDEYTADSSICTAAAHAGFLTVRDGGTVTVEGLSGARRFGASSRNGIVTYAYGPYRQSFAFLIDGRQRLTQADRPLPLTWQTPASVLADVDAPFAVLCPPSSTTGTARGDGDYTTDSSVCTAALHAGEVTLAGGGEATIEHRPGRRLFGGSRRSGVTTHPYGAAKTSFAVLVNGEPPAVPAETPILWETTASLLGETAGERYQLRCPASGAFHAVWGTDVYSIDSSICTAAVHAGRIDMTEGGVITVETRTGRSSFVGTIRGGVTSAPWGAVSRSFAFVP